MEGTWEEEDDEVVVAITKEDPLGGPRSDRDVTLTVEDAELELTSLAVGSFGLVKGDFL